MRRKVVLVLSIFILLTVAVLLCACAGMTDRDVIKIQIQDFNDISPYYDEELDLTDAKLLVTFSDGSTKTVDIERDMISGYDKRTLGAQTVTVTYENRTASIEVQVRDLVIEAVEIASKPSLVTVLQGGEIDLSGITLGVRYQSGKEVIVNKITSSMISGYSREFEPGTYTVTINYGQFAAYFDVEVLPKTIKSISVNTKPYDLQYFIGETLNPEGLVLQLTYDNGAVSLLPYSSIPSSEIEFVYDFSKELSVVKVVVNYAGKSTSFSVSVSNKTITSIAVSLKPRTVGFTVLGVYGNSDCLNIVEGDRIDRTTGSILVSYNDGSSETVSLADNAVYIYYDVLATTGAAYIPANFFLTEVGKHKLNIYYGSSDRYAVLDIEVINKTAVALIISDPQNVVLNKDYVVGQTFSTSFLKYNILYNNNTYAYDNTKPAEWANLSDSMKTGDSSFGILPLGPGEMRGEQVIGFTVENVIASVTVNVIHKKAKSIIITAPTYNYISLGGTIDWTGSSMLVQFNDGSAPVSYAPVPLEEVSLSYELNGEPAASFGTAGEYTVTVTYLYASASFIINAAADSELAENVSGLPAPDAFYSSFPDLPIGQEGFTALVTYKDSSTETILVDSSMLYQYDPYGIGEQTIVFRYRGCLFEYNVNILGVTVASIELMRAPKTVYVIGADTALDISGMRVKKLYKDGNATTTDSFLGRWTFTGYDLSVAGAQTVTVTYTVGANTFTFDYDIIVSAAAVTAVEFDTTQPGVSEIVYQGQTYSAIQVTYKEDFNSSFFYTRLDSNGNTVTTINDYYINVIFPSSSITITIDKAYINYDKNISFTDAEGNLILMNQYTVSYGGKSTYIYLYCVQRTLVSVAVYSTPRIIVYAVGQKLKLDGGLLERTYSDGYKDVIPMTSGALLASGYLSDPFIVGESAKSKIQSITLTYGGKTTSFQVTSYKKLTPEINYAGFSIEYGLLSNLRVTVRQTIASFSVPACSVEYYVGGSWTDTAPVVPGTYPLRVTVEGNEYYNAGVFEGQNYIITPPTLTIRVTGATKEYRDADAPIRYELEGLVGSDRVSFILKRAPGEQAGSYLISYELLQDASSRNGYYNFRLETAYYTITPKTDNGYEIQNVVFTTDSTGLYVEAYYTDSDLTNIHITGSDIYYTDEFDNILSSPPLPGDRYKVWISGNYAIKETSRYKTVNIN